MKREYYKVPENMKGLEAWGFNWLEFVTSIPSPMFLVTTYKSNGKTNVCSHGLLLLPLIKEAVFL